MAKIARREFIKYALVGGGVLTLANPKFMDAALNFVKSIQAGGNDVEVLNYGRGSEVLIKYRSGEEVGSIAFEPGLVQARDVYPTLDAPAIQAILEVRKESPIRDPYAGLVLNTEQMDFVQNAARRAWEYMDYYTQSNGLTLPFVVHDLSGKDDTSQSLVACWELGSMLLATVAGVRAGVLSQEQGSVRLKTTLTTIANLETYKGSYTSFYDAVTLKRTDLDAPDFGRGLEGVDVGRLLIGLYSVRQNYPDFADLVAEILVKIPIDKLVAGGELQDVGYDGGQASEQTHPLSEYASIGIDLFGQQTVYQSSPIPYEQVSVDGYDFYLPSQGTITSILGPYLYQVFEMDYQHHALAFPVLEKIMMACQIREQKTGKITATTEGSSIRRGAANLYCAVVSRKYSTYQVFPVFHHPTTQLVDPSFSMDALRFASTGGVLSQLVLNDAFQTDFDWATRMEYLNSAYIPGRGFYNGKYDADKQWNLDLDLNNHALLLEAAAYAITGVPLAASI